MSGVALTAAGRVTGRVHQPADGDRPESFELYVESDGQPTRHLQVPESIYDWVRMGAVVQVNGHGDAVEILDVRQLKEGVGRWQP